MWLVYLLYSLVTITVGVAIYETAKFCASRRRDDDHMPGSAGSAIFQSETIEYALTQVRVGLIVMLCGVAAYLTSAVCAGVAFHFLGRATPILSVRLLVQFGLANALSVLCLMPLVIFLRKK